MGRMIAKRLRGMNWMAKVSLMLIFTLILSVAIYGVHTYKLRKAEAASGDVILLWDTANGAVPVGWANISGLVGDPFYGVFPRAAVSYGAATAGSDTHTNHTLTYSSSTGPSATLATGEAAGADIPGSTHTHTWGAPTVGAGDVRPPFKNLVFIRASNPTQIPINAIAVFDGSLPSGFTRYSTLDTLYLRGFSDNLTGGAATHTHTVSVTSGGDPTLQIADTGNTTSNPTATHTHSVSSSLSTAANNNPPYVDVIFAYNSSGTDINIPSGLIAFFDATPTGNWTTVSNAAPWTGNFLKGSATFGNPSGNSAAHGHGASQAFTSGAPSLANTKVTAGVTVNASDAAHTHNVTYTIGTSSSTLPVYRDVILAKYTPPAAVAPTLTSPTATLITNTTATLGATITSNGGAALTARGTCWGPTPAPATNCVAEGGTATGVFTQARTTLTAQTLLYYRGYATNSVGTAYSPDGSFYTEPTTQASAVTFSPVGSTTMTVNWTRGSGGAGGGVIVLMKSGSAVTGTPADGTYTGYTASTTFGSGTLITDGYVVYKGPGTSVPVTGLTPSTTYYIAVFEFAGQVDTSTVNQGTNYKLTPATGFQATSAAAVAPTVTSPTATSVLSTTATLGANVTSDGGAALTANGTCWATTATPAINCVDQGSHVTGVFTQARTSLTEGSLLYYRGYATNSAGTGYSTDGTIYTEPTQPTTLSFTGVGQNGMTVNWAIASSGNADNVIVVMRSGSAVNADPVDGTTYTAAAAFGSGTEIGTGNYVVYKGTGTSVPVTALSASTTYYVKVYAYAAGAGGTENYNVISPLAGSWATSAPNSAPTLSISQPDGVGDTVTVGANYSITYTLADSDNVVTAAFYYDNDAVGLNGTAITGACATAAEGSGVTCSWDTTAMALGSYYVYGITNDGVNPQVSAYSPGMITINAGALPSTITSCAGCHTYPPTDGTQRNTPEGAVVGSHSEHSYICSSCHVVPVTETSVDFKHRNSNIQFQGAVSYSKGNNPAQTNDLSGAGLGNCNTATCHNAYGSSGSATPVWGQNATCNSCHAIAGDGAPNTGSHSRHMSLSGALCNQCHAGAVKNSDGGTGHIDNNIDVANNNYTPNVTKHTSGLGYSTCSTIYCHSNVQNGTAGGGPTSYGTPTWGATPPLTCSTVSCHGNAPATPTANNAHGTHTTGNYTFVCSACHNNGGDESANHANGTLNMNINATYGGTYSQGDHTPGSGGYGTCATVYCHGNYTGSGGASLTPSWAVAVACGDCHKYLNTDPPTPGNHGRHAGQAAGQLNLTCAECHELARVLGDGHVNLSVQWNLDRTDTKIGSTATYKGTELGATGLKAPSAAYGTCGSVYCHSSVQSNPGTGAPAFYATPTWGAASVTCDSCHGQGTGVNDGQPSTGGHEKHVATNTYVCSVCHSGHGEDISTHANGTINITFSATAGGSAAYSRGATITPQSAVFGTCSTTYCHGTAASPAWNSTTTCSSCHVSMGAGTGAVANTGVHSKHTASSTYKFACENCHDSTQSPHAKGLADAVVPQRAADMKYVGSAGTKQYGGGGTTFTYYNMTTNPYTSGGITPTYAKGAAGGADNSFPWTTGTCGTLWCHSNANPLGGANSYLPPTWTGTYTLCNNCHSRPADGGRSWSIAHDEHLVTYTTNPNITCNSCHSTVASDNITISNAANHVNGSKNVSMNTWANSSATYNGSYQCLNTYCHSIGIGATSNSGDTRTVQANTSTAWNGGSTTCTSCHTNPPNYANNNATYQFKRNSHTEHTAYTCDKCHYPTTTNGTTIASFSNHVNKLYNVNNLGSTITYTFALNGGTCIIAACHGAGTPTWGASTTYATCVKCHGVATSSPAQFTADTNRAAPGYTAAVAPVGPGVDTAGQTGTGDTQVGTHDAHLRGIDNISSSIACTECHANVTTSITFTGHMNGGSANLNWGTLATAGGKTPSYTAPNCTNTYCHTANRPAGAGAGYGGLSTVTAWTNAALIGNTTVTDTCINKCHEMPPRGGVAGDSHAGLTAPGTYTTPVSLAACSSNSPATGCHPTINAAPTLITNIFFDKTKHINASVEGGSCTGCHAAAVSSPVAATLNAAVTTRRAIVPEFALASNHVRSRGSSVTDNDCGVCHMEGTASNGAIDLTYHKNGYIDLRDPDSGNPIQDATWTNVPAGAGSYTSSGTALNLNATPANRLVRFSRGLSSNTIEIQARSIMINQCLHCHDNNGANNASAVVPSGTYAKPFNTTIAGAGYTGAGVTAGGVLGGVTDIAYAFATANASYHPMLGKQNNSYANATTMLTPWNFTKTAGNNTSWGYLMTCWDCHAPSGASGVQTSTVTAHGAATATAGYATLRAAYTATVSVVTPLCVVCHNPAKYWTTNYAHVAGGGSAYNDPDTSKHPGSTTFRGCTVCHGTTTYAGVLPGRPTNAINVHGFNTIANGTTLTWPSGSKPYSFMRCSNNMSDWTVKSCDSGATNMCGTTKGPGTYTPGGTY